MTDDRSTELAYSPHGADGIHERSARRGPHGRPQPAGPAHGAADPRGRRCSSAPTGRTNAPSHLARNRRLIVPVGRPPPGFERLVLYAYPRTGRPSEDPLTPDWDQIPGARGCTPESCGFRDHAAELAAVGAAVAGVSTQPTDYQREAVARLRLPFPLLSDANLRLADALRFPTFEVGGHVLLKRLTLIVRDGLVEKVFYPVFPPDSHAKEVLGWIQTRESRR